MPGEERIRVLIADDHALWRRGLQIVLEEEDDIEVVGEAANGMEASMLALDLQPDVVIMDLHMPERGIGATPKIVRQRIPERGGIEATRQIVRQSPHIFVLAMTISDDDDDIFAAMRAGARGYVLKDLPPEEVARVIYVVASGEAIFGPSIAGRLIKYFAQSPGGAVAFPELTGRERDVLKLIARGLSNSSIADELAISPKTVRNHISNIFTKLHVIDRAQAIVKAHDAGLGMPPPRYGPLGS